jgi:hypothetical protein
VTTSSGTSAPQHVLRSSLTDARSLFQTCHYADLANTLPNLIAAT